MTVMAITRRAIVVGGGAALLGACAVIPRAPRPAPPVAVPVPIPTATSTTAKPSLPVDRQRHRVALLVPTTGSKAAVGQSIANATTMALMDTNAANLRITTYDTAQGVQAAARRAVDDGNALILGPLMGSDVAPVMAVAGPARVPVISFSNDSGAVAPGAFLMGAAPDQSIDRTVDHAHGQGARTFAVLAPDGEYGQRAEAALRTAVARHGGRVVGSEIYARGNTSILSAAQRLKARGGIDAVLIADGPRLAAQGAAQFRPGPARILGTELWAGESAVTRSPALNGALFSAIPDDRYQRFASSYRARFGGAPYRIATLGYDAVLLTLRVAREWQPGRPFPVAMLRDPGGFRGLDGAFRFAGNGMVERAMEVREVRSGTVAVVAPAPDTF